MFTSVHPFDFATFDLKLKGSLLLGYFILKPYQLPNILTCWKISDPSSKSTIAKKSLLENC